MSFIFSSAMTFLIKLYLEWVLPVCLPFGMTLVANITQQMSEVAGWGLTDSQNKKGTPYLQTVKVRNI